MAPVIGLFYRNSQAYAPPTPYSHIGLGINALHTARVLREHGYSAYPHAIFGIEDTRQILQTKVYTHAILEAFWLTKTELRGLVEEFPDVQFFIRCHSQIGFLQTEPKAIESLRDALALQESELNLKVAGNSKRFKEFVEGVYNQSCILLPNLYDVERVAPRPHHEGCQHPTLRIASFGAMRQLKLHTTAAAGALLLAERRGRDLEFHISIHREEHGMGVLQSLRNLFKDLPWATLVENPWKDWGDFRRLVAHMDLCIQVSATETFNLSTADAIAEGVPCVVSAAIDWVPEGWQVDTDDAEIIANVGWNLLADPLSPKKGLEALHAYLRHAIHDWKTALGPAH